ncbi:uncharacterized protein LOC119684400 isoform X3 [Teleopsis dalmanni]|uniref:uncharacterized protein LOC119684400 isoform X3 n=1 Tax=Teleopsis dalmanni TaxID=139649 RepID=UPI0018CFB20B|nr:uncharacterized protein LOC119684400 isoform X3 [Teleopsis dalmanni]
MKFGKNKDISEKIGMRKQFFKNIVPILHFVVACLITYGVFQYFVESTFETKFPRSWNLLDLVKYIYNFEVKNPHQQYFVNLYFARWRVMITAITSSLDYLRLTFCLLNGFKYLNFPNL